MIESRSLLSLTRVSIGDPWCTGCRWVYPNMMPGTSRLVEIWNGPWAGDSNNEDALALWYLWLNQGRHLVATAGSDTHSVNDYAANPGYAHIYAERLTETDLLQALRMGHLYLSSGPHLTLTGDTQDGETVMMGDTLSASQAQLTVTWADCPSDAMVSVIEEGQTVHHQPATGRGEHSWSVTAGASRWSLVEVRDAEGHLVAITNPIYLAP